MTRFEHYKKVLKETKNDDELMGVMIGLFAQYSNNVISRISSHNSKNILDWLEEEIE